MSEVLLHKQAGVERCIKQARSYYTMASEKPFSEDFLKQDAIVVNLQRACEQFIDMANHVIRMKKLGLAADSAESFTLLRKAGIMDTVLERALIRMVGFRNVVVHQYRDIDHRVVETVVRDRSDELIRFAGILAALLK